MTGDDELVPDIAHSWEVLDGGTRYLFHLRDDVSWSDGTPVTAGDFEYSWKRTLNPASTRNLANILYDIKGARACHQGIMSDADDVGVRALDDHTLEVILEGPRNYFLQLLALPVTRPLPKWAIERHGSDWTDPDKIVTNGPFTIQAWSPESSLILERNPGYHGRFTGNLTRFHVKMSPRESWSELYERDELDVMLTNILAPEVTNRLIQLHSDEYLSSPNPSSLILAFDARKPPFDNLLVRQAMIMALDYQSIVGRAVKRTFLPAAGGLTPPGIPGHVPDVGIPYDPKVARQKLAEAGYPGGEGFPSVTAVIHRQVNMGDFFGAFVAEWKATLGLDILYESLDFNDYLDQLEDEIPPMWMGSWGADYPDPDNFLSIATWYRLSGWRHQEYAALIRDAPGISNQGQRLAMYRQAERIIAEEVPAVTVAYGRIGLLIKPWVVALPVSVINGPILREAVLEAH
jgi:oligopeptide transport system substrate-binding protein